MSVTSAAFACTSQGHVPDRLRMQAGNLLIRGLFDGLDLDDLRDTFARALEFWLGKRGLRGVELARKLGTSATSVSRWLNGKGGTDLLVLREIAKELGIPAWYLLHDSPEELPDPDQGGAPKADDSQQALKTIATKLGFKIRIEPLRRG